MMIRESKKVTGMVSTITSMGASRGDTNSNSISKRSKTRPSRNWTKYTNG
jgi:hypothetical protein